MTAIFISHSSKDNAAAQKLVTWLQEQQFESLFLDFDPQLGIPAGRDWEQELYHQLRACRAVIVLCSEYSVASDWCFAEVVMARSLGKKLFPIRIDSCTPPALLADQQMIEFPHERRTGRGRLWKGWGQRFHHEDAQEWAEAYERLLRGLIRAGLDPQDLFQWDSSRPPYPGLLAFQEQDAALFFGRDDAIREGLDAIRTLRRFRGKALLLLLGASGSGKSSLLRAGLLPNLRRDPDAWLVLDPFRPGKDPFAELAIVLSGAFAHHEETRDRRAIADRLRAAATAVPAKGEELKELLTDLLVLAGTREATVVLSIDQFEELLGVGGSDNEAALFLKLLRAALEKAEGQMIALSTMRSDFLDSFQCQPVLRGVSFDQLMLGPMGVEGYTQIIEGPAAMAGLNLEPGLSQRMVKDTETEDALPLLAFTLRELWEYRDAEKGELTLDVYNEKLQGLTGSVQRAADRVIKARPLSEAETTDLRQAFLSMSRINEQGNYARRSVEWEDLPSDCREILQRFVDARLLVSKEQGTVEVAHEALLRKWPLLKDWLDDNREFLLWRQRFQAALTEYEVSRTLLRDAPLVVAQRWRGSTAADSEERKLIDASLTARRRQRLLRRSLLAGAATVLAAFTGTIWWQLQRTRLAQAQQYAANARLFVKTTPLRSLVHGLAAMGTLDEDARESIALSETLVEAMARNMEGFGPAVPADQSLIRSLLALKNGEVISGGENGSLRRWREGKPLGAPIPTDQGKVYSLAELGNGEVVSGGENGTLRRWREGKPLGAPIPTGQGKVYSLAMLANGELVSGGENGSLRRWREGKPFGVPIPTGQEKVLRLLALANGELISGGSDGTLRRWREGRPLGEAIATGQTKILSLVALKDGEVISGGENGTLRRWREGKSLGEPIQTNQDQVGSLAALSSGELISGGWDGTLRRWRDGQPFGDPIQTDQERVWSLVTLWNGELISGGSDGTVKRWHPGRSLSEPIQSGQTRVNTLVALPSGELITGGRDGTLRRWKEGKPIGDPIPTGQLSVTRLVLLRNGELVSGGADGSLRRWQNGEPIGAPIATGQGEVWSLVELRNGELVSGGSDGTLRRWREGQPIGAPIPSDQETVSRLVELDNGELISGGGDGTLRRWRNGQPLGPPLPSGDGEVLSLLALRNGELISGGTDGNLNRWSQGKPLGQPIPTGQGMVWSLLEWGNGDVLSGGNDGTLRVWSNGAPLGEALQVGTGKILNLVRLTVIDDQRQPHPQLVSSFDDGTFRIYQRPETVVREACLQLRHHPALLTPRAPAEKEASRTCRQLPVLPPSHS